MWAEIRANAKNELFHIMFITSLILKEAADIKPVDEISIETLGPREQSSGAILERWKLILDLYKKHNLL